MILCILGRQPEIGMAELESIYGAEGISQFGGNIAIINGDAPLRGHIGSIIKAAQAIKTIPSSNWYDSYDEYVSAICECIKAEDGASGQVIPLGFSAYGFPVSMQQMLRLSFDIKGRLKFGGVNTRIIENKELALNSAQIVHNNLAKKHGYEFILASDGAKTHIARTVYIQDIDSYSKRDYGRPRRDAKVGMLPPKLAQIMLNLCCAQKGETILDPFCGTGALLMEAALMGAKPLGSDINPKMVEYTRENLKWLYKEYAMDMDAPSIICADATKHKWKDGFDRVASELYLGPPMTGLPRGEQLHKIVRECDVLVDEFLGNLRPQLAKNSRCCIAVPAWTTPDGLARLPIIARLARIGYERVRFAHAGPDIIYRRPDQTVARELLVLRPI